MNQLNYCRLQILGRELYIANINLLLHYTEKVPGVVQKCNPRYVELVLSYQRPGADLWI